MAENEIEAIKMALEEVLATAQKYQFDEFFSNSKIVLPENPISRARTIQTLKESTDRIEKKRIAYLDRVKEVLAKIKNGSYGACEDCGDHISRIILKCDPLIQVCPHCEEHRKQQRGLPL